MDISALPARNLGEGELAELVAALPTRCLDEGELAELAAELARRPELWQRHVCHAADSRHYASLHRDEFVDVWLLCWTPGNDTGWHDHDVSSGAVQVVQGALKESNPRIGGIPAETVIVAGDSLRFGPDHIHRLTGEAAQSVSIHAYSPPLTRLGQYTIDEAGVLRRLSVGYEDELRPRESGMAAPAA
jgi:predicted metal-dependent enzyme (double-stranded beta helix superfamily)